MKFEQPSWRRTYVPVIVEITSELIGFVLLLVGISTVVIMCLAFIGLQPAVNGLQNVVTWVVLH